jgi:hypothetical protein
MSVSLSSHPQDTDPREAAHVCGTCLSPLVQCASRRQLTAHHWEMTLDCPECGWGGTGDFSADEVEAFDEHAERASAAMGAEVAELAGSRIDDVVAEFAAGLPRGV